MTVRTVGNATLHRGDCLEVMRSMPDNSVDAVVTDPPYGLSFMGHKWDYDVPSVDVWIECLRILRPGGYLLSFGGTRTYHRLATRIEDAGFTMHPLMAWIFGSGFPKATKVELPDMEGWRYGLQSLKPALEPIAFAQKPFSEKTGAANIARWGTGALNIDGCRVGVGGQWKWTAPRGDALRFGGDDARMAATDAEGVQSASSVGRWPANLCHDGSDEVLAALPNAPGQQGDLNETGRARPSVGRFGDMAAPLAHPARREIDRSAARFFYCAKASRKDRNDGLESSDAPVVAKGATMRECEDADWSTRNGNHHPTVKPTDLMAYYVRLVTPLGGTVLDPYMGSGSTGKACAREGLQFIGIDKDEDADGNPLGYLDIAEARIAFELARVSAALEPAPQLDLFSQEAA